MWPRSGRTLLLGKIAQQIAKDILKKIAQQIAKDIFKKNAQQIC